MSGKGDSIFENDCKNMDGGYLEDIHLREDLEIKPIIAHQRRYKRNLLTNAGKFSIVLEKPSLIDCLEVDEEYIVSAGRDHNINVWVEDQSKGKHVLRLSGHRAPVTGLSLFNSGHSASDKIIVSSSEDGSVRIWSLKQGEELHKIETGSVITCMGIMNKSLAIVGNHKGYMEVYHLRSGELYTSIRAHSDPVDAVEVDSTYACTATFEAPSCLKVWDIQFEQTRCIYRIENSPEIEFCCLAIWNTKIILGASNQQKLFVVDFESELMESIDLERPNGKVQTVKVWNEWIISCSIHKTEVLLDVHRFHNYEHFGTFVSVVPQVRAIAAIELDNSFKIVVGGSALGLLSFDFILTEEETNITFNRFPISTGETSLMHNREMKDSTIKYTDLNDSPDENSTDSHEDDSEIETITKCDEKIGYTLQSNFEDIYFNKEDEISFTSSPTKMQTGLPTYYESKASTPQSDFERCDHVSSQSENVKFESTPPPRRNQMLSPILTIVKRERYMLQDRMFINPKEGVIEPRVAIRKLKEELDKNEQHEELENFTKYENVDTEIAKDTKLQEHINDDNIIEAIEVEDDEDLREETKVEIIELKDDIKYCEEAEALPTNQELSKKVTIEEEIQEENTKSASNKIFKKKNKKCKKDKKKESQKTKHRRCNIM